MCPHQGRLQRGISVNRDTFTKSGRIGVRLAQRVLALAPAYRCLLIPFAYTNSVFAPHLVKDFGWSRAQFALIGLTMLVTLFLLPVIGRSTDRLGVRRVALLGTILVPICFVAYALQQGSFLYFMACSTLVLAVGSMTSPLVYTRLIAENFTRSTGLALTMVNCTPAILAVALVPLLNEGIEQFGWRACYLAMGVLALCGGLGALALLKQGGRGRDGPARGGEKSVRDGDYRVILSSTTFWIIVIGMFLCLLHTPLHASQMNLMLVDNDITMQEAANVVSVYAFGTIVGRIGCGLALDRFVTPVVTSVSMILPCIGLFLLATDYNALMVITFSMFLVGLSVGAESDLVSFMVQRYFALRIYNTTLGLVFVVSFLAAAIGSGVLSVLLKWYDSFSPFLYLVSVSVLIGALLFALLPASKDEPLIGEDH